MRSSLTPFGIIVTTVFFATVLGIGLLVYPVQHEPNTNQSPTEPTAPLPLTNIIMPDQVTLGFVGDIMVHTPMAKSAKLENGEYDFNHMFEQVRELTSTPDIMIGNLETPVTGDQIVSGYPNFDSPKELLFALFDSGFDILQIANNHSLDQGPSGLEATINNIETAGMLPLGGSVYPSMAYEPLIETRNGIAIALIAATYGFNGYILPSDKTHLANTIDLPKIEQSIIKARSQGADIVIVMPHFGTEYQRTPSEEQKKIVDELILMGVDAIIGTHPHVVQPVEERTGIDGKKVLIAYSLGNFISNQQDKYTDLELMLSLTYERDPDTKAVALKKLEKTPLYVHKFTTAEKKHFHVVPLKNAMALENLTPEDIQRIEHYNTIMNTQFEPAAPVTQPSIVE